jgi:hypothetical protein
VNAFQACTHNLFYFFFILFFFVPFFFIFHDVLAFKFNLLHAKSCTTFTVAKTIGVPLQLAIFQNLIFYEKHLCRPWSRILVWSHTQVLSLCVTKPKFLVLVHTRFSHILFGTCFLHQTFAWNWKLKLMWFIGWTWLTCGP